MTEEVDLSKLKALEEGNLLAAALLNLSQVAMVRVEGESFRKESQITFHRNVPTGDEPEEGMGPAMLLEPFFALNQESFSNNSQSNGAVEYQRFKEELVAELTKLGFERELDSKYVIDFVNLDSTEELTFIGPVEADGERSFARENLIRYVFDIYYGKHVATVKLHKEEYDEAVLERSLYIKQFGDDPETFMKIHTGSLGEGIVPFKT